MTTTIYSDEIDVNETLPPDAPEAGDASPREDEETATPDDRLPWVNGRDAISLFAQSPGKLFLHWSHAGDPSDALRKAFGDAASHYRPAVRSVELASGETHIHEASSERIQWLDALPGRDYRADVGFHAEDLPFVNVLSSAVVRTPRDTVSPNADSASQFLVTAEEFSLVLEEIGYDVSAPEKMSFAARAPEEWMGYQRHCPPGSSENSGQWSVAGGQ